MEVLSGSMNRSNSMSDMAERTSEPLMVFRFAFMAMLLEQDVAYRTKTDAALAIATLASLDTLTPSGRDSLIMRATIELGRFKSSGLSAILVHERRRQFLTVKFRSNRLMRAKIELDEHGMNVVS